MAKPKKPDLQEYGANVGEIDEQALRTFLQRNPQLLEAVGGNFESLLGTLTGGRQGEIQSNKDFIQKNIPGARRTGQRINRLARRLTKTTDLDRQIVGEGSRALSDPLAGNSTLQALQTQSGPSALLGQLTTDASAELGRGGELSAEEVRASQQAARSGAEARGMVLGAPAATAEVLSRQSFREGRQDRSRSYAAGVEGLGQSSRGQDIQIGGLTQDAIEGGRRFGLAAGEYDTRRRGAQVDARSRAMMNKLSLSPGMMALGMPSQTGAALGAGQQIAAGADVYPQLLQYGADVNSTNFNAEESRYRNDLNRYYAEKYAGEGRGDLNWWERALNGAQTGAKEGGQYGGAWGALGGAAGGAVDGAANGPIYQMHYNSDGTRNEDYAWLDSAGAAGAQAYSGYSSGAYGTGNTNQIGEYQYATNTVPRATYS